MSGYIGTQPVPQATQTRDSFTATSGQTSFATGGYTPNFLDVYLNGVKLASADYTATNGSDVVLASGASTGDILEVVAYTAFDTANVTGATDFTVTGAFTSQGIDDNGTGTRMTIGSGSDNAVMVGTTVSNPVSSNVQGISFRGAYGEVQISSEGSTGAPLYLNRKSSDGDIEVFRKDGNTVGSIGVYSGSFGVGQGDTGIGFLATDNIAFPSTATGVARDNAIDLGYTAGRFKDAYLSGGIYLGGVGSANKLDDYEEGTFTATLTSQNGTVGISTAYNTLYYTKVGRLVTITGRFRVGSLAGQSGHMYFTVPFTSAPNVGSHEAGYSTFNVYTHGTSLPSGTVTSFAELNPNGVKAYLYAHIDNAAWTTMNSNGLSANDIFYINGTYTTA